MTDKVYPPTTAGIRPERFPDQLYFANNRVLLSILLAALLAAGFCFRVYQLGGESLGEDEFNKLQTVAEYRENGLSSRNGEHPFLMKGLQTVSIAVSERLNASFGTAITEEGALRFPVALFGTFTALLLFLVARELFGSSIGLTAAALWATEPLAISFDRVAKEDGLVLFFFLLSSLFWLKSQTAVETGKPNWLRWVWATAAAFGALMASKYYLSLIGILVGYYHAYNRLEGKHWALGKRRWLTFFIIMGVTLLILNPTLVLPGTWQEMLKFSSESRIGHDSYEFMGALYHHKFTGWLYGVPWTYYYVLAATKTSLTTLLFFLPGLALLFRRRLGDGRIFLFFWFVLWLLPLTFLGGKFMRYFTMSEPLLLIPAAIGFCFFARWLADRMFSARAGKAAFQFMLLLGLIVAPVVDSISAAPHYRLFTNWIGGGAAASGKYFPHDEFYDATSREVIAEVAESSPPGTVVACETPALFAYYAEKAGRPDLVFVWLSERSKVKELREGDVIVLTSGRRYFSNDAYFKFLHESNAPHQNIVIESAVASEIYRLTPEALAGIRAIAEN